MAWLTSTGTYDIDVADFENDAMPPDVLARHKMSVEGHNNFTRSVLNGYNEWGSLTEKQYGAIKSCFAAAHKRFMESILIQARIKETSFVGNVGDTVRLSLTVVSAVERPARERIKDTFYTNTATDSEGNTFCYIGPLAWSKGSTVKVKARIDNHRRVRGEARTYIKDVEFMAARRSRIVE